MKRFHVHVHVDDLAASVAFYSKLFAAQPARLETDYAKWMLEDPRVNFAISARGGPVGVDHLGFQADDAAELAELKARAESADRAMLDEGETRCCYARSEKHWITDPQGIAWEQFHTLDSIPVFSERDRDAPAAAPAATAAGPACCAPAAPQAAKETSACCSPAASRSPPWASGTARPAADAGPASHNAFEPRRHRAGPPNVIEALGGAGRPPARPHRRRPTP